MWLKEENGQLKAPPVNLRTPNGTIMNFDKNPGKLIAFGWREWTEEQIQEWQSLHPQPSQIPVSETFKEACAQFRQICYQIGTAIGDPQFKGGFDEMQEFAQSPVYGTIEGLKLGLAWSAANENCKYAGSKIGLGQPSWWYCCWELEGSDSRS